MLRHEETRGKCSKTNYSGAEEWVVQDKHKTGASINGDIHVINESDTRQTS